MASWRRKSLACVNHDTAHEGWASWVQRIRFVSSSAAEHGKPRLQLPIPCRRWWRMHGRRFQLGCDLFGCDWA